MKRRSSGDIAFGGVLAALSLLLILMTRVIPFSELALPAAAGVLLIAAVVETGPGTALIIYLAVGLLSLLSAFENGAAFYYLLFFGQYTILKNLIERIRSRPLQWVIKIVVFNISALIVYYIMIKLTGLPDTVVKYGYLLTLLAINIVFLLYDFALTRLVVLYFNRIRAKIKKT